VAAAVDHSTQQGVVVALDQLRHGRPGALSVAQNGLDALPVSGSGEAASATTHWRRIAPCRRRRLCRLSVTLHPYFVGAICKFNGIID